MKNGLYSLAHEYHERTEAYDRTVCTGPIIRDEIQPANHYERTLINKNAALVHKEIAARATYMGYTEKELQQAIAHYYK